MSLLRHDPRPTIALVGTFQFPSDNAFSRRILALAKLLEAAGTRPIIGAADPTPDLRPREDPSGNLLTFHLSEFPQRTTPRLLRALRQFIWGGRACAWLEGLQPRPGAVLLYGGYSPFVLWLLRFRRRTGIPVFVDAVEWYQPSHVPGGLLSPFHLNVEWALRRLFPRLGHAICISRYLQRHFEAKGCRTLYLPAVLDVAALEPDLGLRPAKTPLRLAYSGTPGKKDLLDPMVEALLRLDPQGERIRFAIVGPSVPSLLALPALRRRDLRQLPPCLEAPGYVTTAEAMAQVRRADFSVLLRHRQRYAMAGFPTKVPESLAVGTPVICNLTTDLGDFLVDGSQALICSEPTAEACEHTLLRALKLSHQQRTDMRRAARLLAETRLDYRMYLESMRSFIGAITSSEDSLQD